MWDIRGRGSLPFTSHPGTMHGAQHYGVVGHNACGSETDARTFICQSHNNAINLLWKQ